MRTVKTLKPETRGVGRPAAVSGTRSRVPWIADARRPGRGRCDLAGSTAGRLAGEGPTKMVKSAGGRWDPLRQVWILRRDVAERLDLLHRVVGGGG
jgi:hypothetical protein